MPRAPRAFICAHALRSDAEENHIMGMPAAHPVSTIDELLALPDDGLRHELLDGEHVVTQAPTVLHQLVLSRLNVRLIEIFANTGFVVLWSPADIRFGPTTLVQPDLFVVAEPTDASRASWQEIGVPLVAVEVLSPSTATRDRGKKRRIYLGSGVEEYWIVDPGARLIERWRRGDERPEIVHDRLALALSVDVEGSVDMAELFRTVR
jgi:Uma2 family endonuclease